MTDISHLGTIVTISASNTTADVPLPLTAFPKDTDPVQVPSQVIGSLEIGTNGDIISWSEATPGELTLAVIPGTADHAFLNQLFIENKAEKGKRAANDIISLTRVMPNGAILAAKDGKIVEGPPAMSQASSGRISTVSYRFMFGKIAETPAVLSLSASLL